MIVVVAFLVSRKIGRYGKTSHPELPTARLAAIWVRNSRSGERRSQGCKLRHWERRYLTLKNKWYLKSASEGYPPQRTQPKVLIPFDSLAGIAPPFGRPKKLLLRMTLRKLMYHSLIIYISYMSAGRLWGHTMPTVSRRRNRQESGPGRREWRSCAPSYPHTAL